MSSIKEVNPRWDNYFLMLATLASAQSRDFSGGVGCIIAGPDKEVRSTGYNGFPRGVDDSKKERYLRPAKYSFTEHAERNAVYNASRHGVSLANCVAYVTIPPCADCARALVQSGIVRVVYPKNHDYAQRQDWKDSFQVAATMFQEAGVVVDEVFLDPNLFLEFSKKAHLKFSVSRGRCLERDGKQFRCIHVDGHSCDHSFSVDLGGDWPFPGTRFLD